MEQKLIERLTRWPIIEDNTIDRCIDYLKKGKISIPNGDILEEFEKNFSEYLNMKYALAHNNGTSSLYAAYYALGLKAGDCVLIPNFTWTATAAPLLPLGVIPIFCDVDEATLNISVKDMEKKYNPQVKAVIAVHMWGNPCDMDSIMSFAKKHNIYVVEDCSHAHGAVYKGKKVGTFGDIACFSMQATKIVAGGELGIAVTNSYKYYKKMVELGQQGRIKELLECEARVAEGGLGYKFRPFPLALIIANDQLKKIDKINKDRRRMLEILNSVLTSKPSVKIVRSYSESERTCYSYIFEYTGRKEIDNLVSECLSQNVPIHKMRYKLVDTIEPFTKYKTETPIIEKKINRLLMVDLFNCGEKELIEKFAKELGELL